MSNLNLISWNVNGIRAAGRKGFLEFLATGRFDLVAVQETKVSDPQILSPELRQPLGYQAFWHSATEKKGYSGVAVFTKMVPKKVKTDFGHNLLSAEGRILELHFDNFVFLNIYFPNGGAGPDRLKYKLEFYDQFLKYLKRLSKSTPRIVFGGDLNTAHHQIDLARPKANEKNSGFMPIERRRLDEIQAAGFIDTFRQLHPQTIKYSWWDLKTRARDRNVGWRIDGFYISSALQSKVATADILTDVFGSDHAPVRLVLES